MSGAKSKRMLARGNSSVNGYGVTTVSVNHTNTMCAHTLTLPSIPQLFHKAASGKASMSASTSARERGAPPLSKSFRTAVQLKQIIMNAQHN